MPKNEILFQLTLTAHISHSLGTGADARVLELHLQVVKTKHIILMCQSYLTFQERDYQLV